MGIERTDRCGRESARELVLLGASLWAFAVGTNAARAFDHGDGTTTTTTTTTTRVSRSTQVTTVRDYLPPPIWVLPQSLVPPTQPDTIVPPPSPLGHIEVRFSVDAQGRERPDFYINDGRDFTFGVIKEGSTVPMRILPADYKDAFSKDGRYNPEGYATLTRFSDNTVRWVPAAPGAMPFVRREAPNGEVDFFWGDSSYFSRTGGVSGVNYSYWGGRQITPPLPAL